MISGRTVAIACALIAGACGTAQPTMPTTAVVQLTDESAGFSFSIPQAWTVLNGASPTVRDDLRNLVQQDPRLKGVSSTLGEFSYAAFDLTDSSSALPSTLVARRNPGEGQQGATFGMAQSLGFMGYGISAAGGRVVAYEDVVIGAYDGKRLVLETPDSGQAIGMRISIFAVDRTSWWYSLTFIADPGSGGRTDAQFADIASTFRLADSSVATVPARTMPPVVQRTATPQPTTTGFVVRGRISSSVGAVRGQVRAYLAGTSVCCHESGFVETAEDGTFALRLSAGVHRLLFIPEFTSTSVAPVASEWWKGAEDFAHATDLDVASDRSGIDVTLRPRSSISGRVVYEPTGAPIERFGVLTYFGEDITDIAAWWVYTDSDGRFTVQVPPGVYRLKFEKVGYLVRWWDHAVDYGSATAVTVTADRHAELLHAIPAASR